MKSIVIIGFIAAAVSAQSSQPKWIAPTKSSYVELTAYNLPGYTTQQLWGWRNVEKIVKYDTSLGCVYEGYKSNGVEQQYDAYCFSKDVHWKSNAYPQCSSTARTFSVADSIKTFWQYYDSFSVFQGQVEDPFQATGIKFYRAKHSAQNRWIWYRTTDKAIVYEQYYDGTQSSWVKYFEGGIIQNNYLFNSDFRIPKCSNPFVAMPSVGALKPTMSFLEQNPVEENVTPANPIDEPPYPYPVEPVTPEEPAGPVTPVEPVTP